MIACMEMRPRLARRAGPLETAPVCHLSRAAIASLLPAEMLIQVSLQMEWNQQTSSRRESLRSSRPWAATCAPA
jgi:hypothetical protein